MHLTPGVNVGYSASKQKLFTSDSFEFKCGLSNIEAVPSYKYLGIWLDEHSDYHHCVTAIAEVARKSLGLLISKTRQFGNFPFEALQLSIRITSDT